MKEAELEAARKFAERLHTDAELDDILELEKGTVAAAVTVPDSPLGRAVRAGRLKTISDFNSALISTALRHSTPAQQAVMAMINKLRAQ